MPEQNPPRQPFNGLSFIRNLMPNGGNVPEIQPDPEGVNLPAPPAQQAGPAQPPQPDPQAPAVPPQPAPMQPRAAAPVPAPQVGSINFPAWDWRPIQSAPAYTSMAENVRQLLAGYSQAQMGTMSIAIPYMRANFEAMMLAASEHMTEMALPPALASVSTGAYMHTFARNDIDVRLFTDAERSETLLFTSRPLPMVYRWAGGPRAELNVPVAQVQALEAAPPVIEVPEIFTRPVPERPVYAHDPFFNVHYRVENNPAREPDRVTNEEARVNRAEAWLPATLIPGYMVENVRAEARAIVGRFTAVPLEDMRVLIANLHGQEAVLNTFNSGEVYNEGVRLNEDQTIGTIGDMPINVLLHTNPTADGMYIYLHSQAPMLLKVEGPLLPEIAELPRYVPGQDIEANLIGPGADPDEDPDEEIEGPEPF